ncbi:MAG TPA: glycosyl hydrolase family 28-related protein [Thermoanaerobaculia bacterium]
MIRSVVLVVLVFLSANLHAELNLLGFGADPSGIADSGPALQAAIDAMGGPNGTSLYVPPGTYRIATGVTRNFLTGASSIVIRGEGSGSIFKIAVGAHGRALQLQNLESVLLDNLTFVSSTTNGSAIDAKYTLSLEYCKIAVIRRTDFYGITTVRGGPIGRPEGAVVYAYYTDLRIEQSSFRGCAGDYTIGETPFDGTPVVDNDNWTGLSVSDTDFIDWGILNGVGYIGATSPPSSAWIRLGRPIPRSDGHGAAGGAASAQAHVVLRRVRLDEGAYYAVAIRTPQDDPSETISHVTMSGLMINGFNDAGTNFGSGIYVNGVDHVTVERSWMGWTSYAPKAAIDLTDVGSAVIDGVICDLTRMMTKLKVSGDTHLTIRNSVYSTLEGTPKVLNVETDNRMAGAVPVRVVSSSTSATAQDQIIISTQAGTTVKLPPSAAYTGRRFTIKNASSGVVLVRAADGMVDGVSTRSLVSPNSTITVVAAQNNWYIVSQIGTVQ